MKRKHLILLLCLLFIVAMAVIGCQKTPAPTPTEQPRATATYVGTDACKTCHTKAHEGFTKSKHYSTFKPLSAYNITDLPQQITIFDADTAENPKSTTVDLSKAYGVMVDDYVVAAIPEIAGFKGTVYRVAAVHKSGDKWTLEPARKGDFNKDGTEDWGGSNYTCGTCHSPGLGRSEKESTIGCESCHGPGSTHVTAEDKTGTMIVNQDACMTCHTSYPAKNATSGVWEANNHYGTRNYFASKHADSVQTNDCLACHTPHGVNSKGQTVIGDDPVKDNCVKCHQNATFKLDTLMWKNPSDLRDHITRDHSFGAMPYDKLGDDKATKPIEITNPDYIKIIEEKVPKK